MTKFILRFLVIILGASPCLHAGSMETLKGKVEQDKGKYILCLPEPYTLEFGGQSIASKRLQLDGLTSADVPKLDAAKGRQIELTGYVYPGTAEDSEKLVFFVKEVPGNSPAIQTVIINAPVAPTPVPPQPTPIPVESPKPTATPIPTPTPPPTPPPAPKQNPILGAWVTSNGAHDYSNVVYLQFSEDNTGRIVNRPSGSRVSPKAYRFAWRVENKTIWVNLLDGRTGNTGWDRGTFEIITLTSSTMTLDFGDETRVFTKLEQ